MGSIAFINTLILGGAMLLLAGILSSVVATRFGAPLLLVFLCLGMVAGEDGPGGIVFSDYRATYLVGRLRWRSFFSTAACAPRPQRFAWRCVRRCCWPPP